MLFTDRLKFMVSRNVRELITPPLSWAMLERAGYEVQVTEVDQLKTRVRVYRPATEAEPHGSPSRYFLITVKEELV